jgi:hypothetical protein
MKQPGNTQAESQLKVGKGGKGKYREREEAGCKKDEKQNPMGEKIPAKKQNQKIGVDQGKEDFLLR